MKIYNYVVYIIIGFYGCIIETSIFRGGPHPDYDLLQYIKLLFSTNFLNKHSTAVGEIVCDPMCGGGSISLETAINWPASFNLCGDNFQTAPSRTQGNLAYVNGQRAAEEK